MKSADEGLFVGYSTNSKAFRVFNSRTRIVEENLHVQFIVAGNQSNGNASTKACNDAGKARMETESLDVGFKPSGGRRKRRMLKIPGMKVEIPTAGKDNVGTEADMNNLDVCMPVSPILTTRIHKDHPVDQIIGDLNSTPQTRRMTKNLKEHVPELKQSDCRAVYVTTTDLKIQIPDRVNKRGKIDKTLFIRRDKSDILLVQVYVDDIIFGSTKKSLCTEFEKIMHKKFQMSSMGELTFFLGLQVKQKEDGIFISQDKYATEILKKFGFSDIKTTSKPMETHKPLLKDANGEDVDEHLYRSMIGSLMYLTSSRPDIMFVVCACARFQVNPKISHLHAVKRIFRYLKGQPKLGLWYPKDSPFDLVAYTDSDYAGASLDRKSTTGGCQFLGCRLISWQCKKQTVVANSTTEAEYIAASNCLKNPVFHSKTKHIETRHHFIRDSYKKKLIQMIKIHTDQNVADLLTKAFDVSIFQYLIASIRMLNL
ncbi:uncharacterized mitochondrial protein-like protein [Tanacetum coccineum]|uniref:Uncharacterized mitochondrial protein-like protein n=1 Tax=Tanacetum coccineum TaxID=301880 RepID=A0ABQ5HKT3_9ASTR